MKLLTRGHGLLISASHRTLRIRSTIGAAMIVVVVFLFSFGSLLATWSGSFVPSGPEDYGNAILFTLLANAKGATTPTVTTHPLDWKGRLVVV